MNFFGPKTVAALRMGLIHLMLAYVVIVHCTWQLDSLVCRSAVFLCMWQCSMHFYLLSNIWLHFTGSPKTPFIRKTRNRWYWYRSTHGFFLVFNAFLVDYSSFMWKSAGFKKL